jgi:hypothetical protein
MAMLAAVICMLVIITLTAVAVQQSVGSLSGFAQGRKLLQTVDAAETGLQSEISSIQHWLSAPTSTVPCQGGAPITGLPSGGWVAAASAPADSVRNAASLGYYTLSLATYTTQPSGAVVGLPASAACYNNSISTPTGLSSWYVIAQAKGVTSAITGGSTAMGRTLQALLLVHDNASLAAFHRPSPRQRASNGITLIGFYSNGSGTYTSNASVQAFNVTSSFDAGASAPVNPTSTSASYSGSGPPDLNVVCPGTQAGCTPASSAQPLPTLLSNESWLNAGALAQYAEADSSGSSTSCGGMVASPGSILVGSSNPSCNASGSPSATGVTFDLSKIPSLSTALSSLADITLETSAITCAASMGIGGSSTSGSASLGNLFVRVAVPLGATATVAVSVGTGPNLDLMSAVTDAISSDSGVLGLVTPTLVSTLKSTLSLTSNDQTINNGVFSVSAIHATLLSGTAPGATADLALCQVGPNTFTSGSPTTTTTVPSTTTTTAPGSTTTTSVPSATTTTTAPVIPNSVSIVWIRQVA